MAWATSGVSDPWCWHFHTGPQLPQISPQAPESGEACWSQGGAGSSEPHEGTGWAGPQQTFRGQRPHLQPCHTPRLEAPGRPGRQPGSRAGGTGLSAVHCPQPPSYHPASAGHKGGPGLSAQPCLSASISPRFLCGPRPPDSRAKGRRLFTQDSPATMGKVDTRDTPPIRCPWRGAQCWLPRFRNPLSPQTGCFHLRKTNTFYDGTCSRACEDADAPPLVWPGSGCISPHEHAVNIKFSEASSTPARSTA